VTLSLAFISQRSFPGGLPAKPLLVVAVILAGCGGSGGNNWQQVQGNGFQFNAPADWTVDGATARKGPVDLVQAQAFRLLRPYDRSRRAAVARELDADAARIADQLHGSVTSRRSLEVGGLDARSYVIAFDRKVEEITFVLNAQKEYELLCRRAADGDTAACTELLESFSVGK
jgi:hypothetical protein